MPLQSNVYLERLRLKHPKVFSCLAFFVSLICMIAGVVSLFLKFELWFTALFLIAGFVGLICTVYLTFAKCVVDQEKIEKRAIICLKRICWRDVTQKCEVNQKPVDKQILLVYSGEKLTASFESPAKGMDQLLDLAKQKSVPIKRYSDLTAALNKN